jgi:hypothetical protein
MIEFRVDRARRLVEATGTGLITFGELVKSQSDISKDPDFDPSFALLADYRAASFAKLDVTDVRRLVQTVPFNATAPRAFLIGSDMDFALVRLFGVYNEVQHTGLARGFRDQETAMSWIEQVRTT